MAAKTKKHRWSVEQRQKYLATMRSKKRAGVAPIAPTNLPIHQPSVDIERQLDRSHRHGLITAIECILRELR
jgi:hypothetical protein